LTHPRVHFLDDNFPQREAVLACLRAFPLVPADTADVVVVALGQEVGLEVLARYAVPVVVVSAAASVEEAVQAIRQGACDYLGLAQLERLPDAVRAAWAEGAPSWRLLDSLPGQVALLDSCGRVRAASPGWSEPRAGECFVEFCQDRWGDEAVAELQALLRGDREEFWREYSSIDTEGSFLWFEFRARLRHGLAGAVVTHREVPEKRPQFWCWESETVLSQIARALSQCFWLMTPESEVLYMSPEYEVLTGYGRSLAFSRTDRIKIVHEEDRDRILAARQQLAVGANYDMEFRILRRDGEIRWLRSRGFPVRDAQGKLVRMAGVMEDVTERRAAPAPPPTQGVRVAIAEDEIAIRTLLSRVLRRRGFDALEIDDYTGDEVDRLDVLITDVFLPGVTGVELAARLRERFPRLRVIYMSGYTPEALAALGLAPTPLLLKPFAPEQLLEALRRVLEQDYQVT